MYDSSEQTSGQFYKQPRTANNKHGQRSATENFLDLPFQVPSSWKNQLQAAAADALGCLKSFNNPTRKELELGPNNNSSLSSHRSILDSPEPEQQLLPDSRKHSKRRKEKTDKSGSLKRVAALTAGEDWDLLTANKPMDHREKVQRYLESNGMSPAGHVSQATAAMKRQRRANQQPVEHQPRKHKSQPEEQRVPPEAKRQRREATLQDAAAKEYMFNYSNQLMRGGQVSEDESSDFDSPVQVDSSPVVDKRRSQKTAKPTKTSQSKSRRRQVPSFSSLSSPSSSSADSVSSDSSSVVELTHSPPETRKKQRPADSSRAAGVVPGAVMSTSRHTAPQQHKHSRESRQHRSRHTNPQDVSSPPNNAASAGQNMSISDNLVDMVISEEDKAKWRQYFADLYAYNLMQKLNTQNKKKREKKKTAAVTTTATHTDQTTTSQQQQQQQQQSDASRRGLLPTPEHVQQPTASLPVNDQLQPAIPPTSLPPLPPPPPPPLDDQCLPSSTFQPYPQMSMYGSPPMMHPFGPIPLMSLPMMNDMRPRFYPPPPPPPGVLGIGPHGQRFPGQMGWANPQIVRNPLPAPPAPGGAPLVNQFGAFQSFGRKADDAPAVMVNGHKVKLFCDVCKYAATSAKDLRRHSNSEGHQQMFRAVVNQISTTLQSKGFQTQTQTFTTDQSAPTRTVRQMAPKAAVDNSKLQQKPTEQSRTEPRGESRLFETEATRSPDTEHTRAERTEHARVERTEHTRAEHRPQNRSYICRICVVKVEGSDISHLRSDEHKKKARTASRGCQLCVTGGFKTYPEYVKHVDGEAHKQKKAELDREVASRMAAKRSTRGNKSDKRRRCVTIDDDDDVSLNIEDMYVIDSAGDNDDDLVVDLSGEVQQQQQQQQQDSLTAKQEQRLADNYKQFMTSVSDSGVDSHVKPRVDDSSADSNSDNNKTSIEQDEAGQNNDNNNNAAAAAATTTTTDAVGMDCVFAVTGYFCSVCREVWPEKQGGVATHCATDKHRLNYQQRQTRRKNQQQQQQLKAAATATDSNQVTEISEHTNNNNNNNNNNNVVTDINSDITNSNNTNNTDETNTSGNTVSVDNSAQQNNGNTVTGQDVHTTNDDITMELSEGRTDEENKTDTIDDVTADNTVEDGENDDKVDDTISHDVISEEHIENDGIAEDEDRDTDDVTAENAGDEEITEGYDDIDTDDVTAENAGDEEIIEGHDEDIDTDDVTAEKAGDEEITEGHDEDIDTDDVTAENAGDEEITEGHDEDIDTDDVTAENAGDEEITEGHISTVDNSGNDDITEDVVKDEITKCDDIIAEESDTVEDNDDEITAELDTDNDVDTSEDSEDNDDITVDDSSKNDVSRDEGTGQEVADSDDIIQLSAEDYGITDSESESEDRKEEEKIDEDETVDQAS